MKPRLLVFAKAPLPGLAKTRLIPLLGSAGAAGLQRNLVRHTLAMAAGAGLPTQLWCHPDPGQPFFRACAEEFAITLHGQRGADLGARMQHAFAMTGSPSILIGTDCPALSADDLHDAVTALAGGHDAVLGPAADGGYYLVGLCRPQPELFRDMPWGGPEVLAESRERLRSAGLRWHELSLRHDIDTPADLIHLPKELLP